MVGIIDLKKKVDIVLTKRNLINVTARAGLAIDISGSMEDLYRNGTVQRVVERILAVATRFDDNGELDVWTFSNGFDRVGGVTEVGFENYVNREIINNRNISKWGGTSYSPVINDVLKTYFPSSFVERVKGKFLGLFGGKTETIEVDTPMDSQEPSILIFITDGETGDITETINLLEAAHNKKIYFQFVGIGNERFRFLSKIADDYSNTGFLKISNVSSISDDDLYEGLITEELASWFKQNV